MSIIRRKRTENYTIIPNHIWDDEYIDFYAKSLLAYLLSRPDNWQVNRKHLQKVTGFGRDKTQKIITSLVERGYIERRAKQGESGQFIGQELIVFDEIDTELPDNYGMPENQLDGDRVPENGVPENPSDGKSGSLISTNKLINTDSNKTPVVPKGKGSRLPENWMPNDEGYSLATSLGVNPDTELEVFRDYWIAVAGAKGVKLNWDATWRNWVRRAKPIGRNKKSQSEKMVEAFANA